MAKAEETKTTETTAAEVEAKAAGAETPKTTPKKEKVYIVEAPVKDYVGVGAAGVHFANGKAEVREGWVLDWYKEHGYKVTEKK